MQGCSGDSYSSAHIPPWHGTAPAALHGVPWADDNLVWCSAVRVLQLRELCDVLVQPVNVPCIIGQSLHHWWSLLGACTSSGQARTALGMQQVSSKMVALSSSCTPISVSLSISLWVVRVRKSPGLSGAPSDDTMCPTDTPSGSLLDRTSTSVEAGSLVSTAPGGLTSTTTTAMLSIDLPCSLRGDLLPQLNRKMTDIV